MPSQLTVIIPFYSIDSVKGQLKKLGSKADKVEFRLDYWNDWDLEQLKALCDRLTLPYIFTLRSASQGGVFKGDERQRQALFKQLITLEPPFADIEADSDPGFIKALTSCSQSTQWIVSQHFFDQTPADLDSVFKKMPKLDGAIYKLITYAKSSLDAMRLLVWLKENVKQHRFVVHAMGEAGLFSRVLGANLGNELTYAALDHQQTVVPDQLTVDELIDVYHLGRIDQGQDVYALLGDPVNRSLGDRFHNNLFYQEGKRALYVKICLNKDDLTDFFRDAVSLGFKGFSVTMPLKSALDPYVDQYRVPIRVVNTLKRENNAWVATNTDGQGALMALKQKINLEKAKVLVIGAGGSAMAIARALLDEDVGCTMVNRSAQRARQIEHELGLDLLDFRSAVPQNINCIINTLPPESYTNEALLEWFDRVLLAKPFVMDINYNHLDNFFLAKLKKLGIQFIDGHQMFVFQAKLQQQFWF